MRETKLQEYGASYHLVELYSTVLSSEPLTVRPVTVFHSHEVFTLHCSTSVPFHHSEPCWECEHSVLLYTVATFPAECTLPITQHLQHLTEARYSKAKYKEIIIKSSSKYILLYSSLCVPILQTES